jgi:translation initiation factor IF-2
MSAATLALMAGCAAQQKGEVSKPAAAEPAKTAPQAEAAPMPSEPAPVAEKPEKPPAEESEAAKTAKEGRADATATSLEPAQLQEQYGAIATDAEREALAEMIRTAALAAQKQAAEQRPSPPAGAAAQRPPAGSDVTGAKTPATQPGAEGAAAKHEGGCGGSSSQPVDLTPPPPDQPQPKFACKETKVTAEPVWKGQTAEFAFEIGNEGQVPLAIRLKGG